MIDSCSTQEELNMEHDVGWKGFLSDDQRYADVINGFACGGCQIVKESDLQELDTQTGFLKATGFALPLRNTDAKGVLKKLIETEPAYQSMEEDAFDVMVQYANAEELVGRKDEYEKEGKVDMCKAITEWLAEEREAGMQTGIDDKTKNVVINMLKRGMSDEDILAIAECTQELVDELRRE